MAALTSKTNTRFDVKGLNHAALVVEKEITVPKTLMGEMSDVGTAIGSFNHIALNVDADKFAEYKAKLEAAGVPVSPILNHDDTPMGVSFNERHESNWVSSMYFHDPDGIQREFAGWTGVFNAGGVEHEAATADDTERHLTMQASATVPA